MNEKEVKKARKMLQALIEQIRTKLQTTEEIDAINDLVNELAEVACNHGMGGCPLCGS